MPWADLDDVRRRWADAPLADDLLASMLSAAHSQLVAYTGTDALPTDPDTAAAWVEADALQTRALGQAQERDGDVLGFGDGFAVRVRPLDGQVKQLLKPHSRVARLG